MCPRLVVTPAQGGLVGPSAKALVPALLLVTPCAAHEVKHLGGEEEMLPVESDGRVSLDALDAALTRSPAVVSVMWVNNETGVIQPVAELARKCANAGVPFHSDAVQAFGKVAFSL